MAETLPNEATTATLANDAIERSVGIQHFLQELTPAEQRRFIECAHHLVYVGFDAGLRRQGASEVSDEIKGRVLAHETGLYLRGYDDAMKRIED